MEKLTFTQASDGWYECVFGAKVQNYTVQLNRASEDGRNNLVVKMSIGSGIEPAIYKNFDGHTDKNVLFGIECVKGSTIIVRSLTEVLDASISDKYSNPTSADAEVIPNEIISLLGLPDNPFLHSYGGGAMIMSKNEFDSLTVDLIGDTTRGTEVEYEPMQITEEMLIEIPDGDMKEYFMDRIGWYLAQAEFAIVEEPPMTAGDTYEVIITLNDSVIFDDEREVLES